MCVGAVKDSASVSVGGYECIRRHDRPPWVLSACDLLPPGKRDGNGVSPQLRETFERVCSDAETLLGKEQTKRRIALTQEDLDEKMDNMRGAVTMGK